MKTYKGTYKKLCPRDLREYTMHLTAVVTEDGTAVLPLDPCEQSAGADEVCVKCQSIIVEAVKNNPNLLS